jgi:RNA polymerase sigma-70 factor (ECF subfamily)
MQSTLRITRDVVRDHGPSLIAAARRVVQTREDAEDLVQEMWIGALGAARRYEGRASVRTWLNAILRRRIADHFRRSRPVLPFEEDLCAGQEGDGEVEVATHELVAHLARKMRELNALEQDALSLCAFEDLDRDDACARLGIARGHLRVLLHRARRKFGDVAR